MCETTVPGSNSKDIRTESKTDRCYLFAILQVKNSEAQLLSQNSVKENAPHQKAPGMVGTTFYYHQTTCHFQRSKSSNLVFMRGSICLQNIKTQPFLQKRMKKQDIEHWGEKQADPVRHLGRSLKSASS